MESVETLFNSNLNKTNNNNINTKLNVEQSLISKYSTIIQIFQKEYFEHIPTVRQCYFFPNIDNEIKVANMLRTCKSTLDVCIFALTNHPIGAAIESVFKSGVKVRLIADDECAKFPGGEVYRLASLGIPTKTDNSVKYHMHHKFAVLDNSVIITGSFNWTSQAVKYNQENILFLECPDVAQKYTEAYNKLWSEFIIEITQEAGKKYVDDHNKMAEVKKLEREKKKEEAKKNKSK